jgi:allophanate hydrolase
MTVTVHQSGRGAGHASTAQSSDISPVQEPLDPQWESRLRKIEDSRNTPVWIHLRGSDDLRRAIRHQQDRVAHGEILALPCTLVAVKDNIDVAGLPTTAACPAYQYVPEISAPAVERLVQEGAVVVGKTNMDAFATGLVGTRSPYGAPSSVLDPDLISGGSSSGSAVAVADGLVDIALGTDTAGSGRVPAVFNGIVGLKPTKGFISTEGVVPAAESFDAVSVFAGSVAEAAHAAQVMSTGKVNPHRCSAPESPVLGIPRPKDLDALCPEYAASFASAVSAAEARGIETTPVDISWLLEVARLLYDGGLVAERYAAVGRFIDDHVRDVDPTVAQIIQGARDIPAHQYLADRQEVRKARQRLEAMLQSVDGLLLPVTTEHPRTDDVVASPRSINARLGTFTNFANLLEMTACAIPTEHAGIGGFGVMIMGERGDDQAVVDLASQISGEAPVTVLPSTSVHHLAVFGAHLRGMPLHHQLTDLGARYIDDIRTAPGYRMVSLDTRPAKPGIARFYDDDSAATIPGELYALTPEALAGFLVDLPAPMSLTQIELSDGRRVTGFSCDPAAYRSGEDITRYGGWRRYIDAYGKKAAEK